jgi:hypothetical protein
MSLGRLPRRTTARVILCALALPCLAPRADAADGVKVLSRNYPGYGRIVVDTDAPPPYTMEQTGDHVMVSFTAPIALRQVPRPPHNVLAVGIDGSTLSFVIKPGTSVHPKILRGQIVFDVLDPPDTAVRGRTTAAGRSADRAAAVPLAMARSPELGGRVATPPPVAPVTPPADIAHTAALPPAADQPPDHSLDPAQPEAPGRDVLPGTAGPMALLARRTTLPRGVDGTAFLLPFATDTGAAMFRQTGQTLVVFDERRPVDMAALAGDPVFGQAVVQLLPAGTLVRIPTADGTSMALSQTPQGWRIAALKDAAKSEPILPNLADGVLTLPADQPSEVVSMADPDTGALLLVGTTRRPGQNVASVRRTTEFILRPTGLGVVVEPLSDALELKVVPAGFTLTSRARGLLMSPQTPQTEALMDAAHLTRRLDFPAMQTDALMRRLTRQIADAAMAPPQARGPKHQAAALSMMALGMSAEAESLLEIAIGQDPREAASADVTALKAIAALMAGRVAESAELDDPRLTGTDDITLWRAVRQATLEQGSPAAAAAFASTAPLALMYPKPISDRIVPLAVETMIEGGQVAPAARLLARRKDDPNLDYARALLRQAQGNTDQALSLLDGLANGHDQFDRARAAVRAAELRLSSGRTTVTETADTLDKLMYAWRGDQRELALRERIAALRGQAGDWRQALSTLRQAETDFPEQAASVHQRLQDAFASMVAGKGLDQMTPIDVVATVDENADLMAIKGGDPVLEEQLADRLLALDLPERAKPVLEKLMQTAASPAGKAQFGATLAALNERESDDAGALSVLTASDAPDLPPALAEKRTLLRANALARTGDTAGAVAALARVGSPAANQARAVILEQAQDWHGAEQAWADYVSATLPVAGALDDEQGRTVLRLTTAAARARDDSRLSALRDQYASRLPAGALADMFRLLTSGPVHGTGDLKQVQQEVSLAQSLPASLKALDGSTAGH